MQAFTRSPAEIFGYDIRYVIPLFQRPYVWEEEHQWYPLWADVRRIADLRIAEPYRDSSVPPKPVACG